MMLLFVSLFGNLIHIENTSYVNYIIPAILLQCIAQGSSTTAIMMNKDMTSGIVTTFCTLPIRKISILNGHILEAFVRNVLSSGFVPTEALPQILRTFAEYQPMTPIIDTMRNALLENPLKANTFIIALLWCIGLTIIFYGVSLVLFQKRLSN